MRVVVISWRDLAHPQAGGSELVVDRLAEGMRRRGHEVALLCGGPPAPHAYEVRCIGGTYTQYLRAPFAAHRHRRWDLLVDVENGIPFFSPLWRRRPSVCLVHHVHEDQWGLRFPPPLAAAGRLAERRLMPFVYRHRLFVTVSESTAAALEAIGVERGRIRVIRWGTDPPGPTDPRSPTPLFGALGRLVPHKRIDLLLEVWARVHEAVGGRLIVAGAGPERERLARLAGPGVEFVGRISDADKWRLLSRAWLLVHTALHEGWGIVVMEAASVGTPALALDVPGVRDAVVDGHTGLLARSPDELARTWVDLSGDPGRRARLGEEARARAAEFTWDRAVDDFLAVAGEAVAPLGAPAR